MKPNRSEHILICLSGAPSNARVIRVAADMASALQAPMTALYVDHKPMDPASRLRLQDHLKLAESLNARIVTVHGENLAVQLVEYAKLSGVSKIVLGQSGRTTGFTLRRKSLADEVMLLAPHLQLYIIPNTPDANEEAEETHWRFHWQDAAKAIGILALTTLVTQIFDRAGFSDANIIMVYLLAVMLTAMVTNGRFYGTAVSLISVVLFNYLYTEPRFTLRAYDADYPVTFLVMFVVSFLAGTLTMQVKSQAKLAATKAYHTQVLLETSQKLQQADSEKEILIETARQLEKLLRCAVLIYPIRKGELSPPLYVRQLQSSEVPDRFLSDHEKAAVAWVFTHNHQAGATTQQFPQARCLYRSVRNHDRIFAIFGLALESRAILDLLEKDLLTAIFSEAAMALEKEDLNRLNTQITITSQQEQLRANLLRSISHDLRTPLTSISGNADFLLNNSEEMDYEKRLAFYRDIYEDAMWLNNLVENLLFITRIENDTMQLNLQPELLSDIVEEALSYVQRRNSNHYIEVDLGEELLMARMESRLIIQVVINLLDNALKYTPAGSHINIRAFRENSWIHLVISDDGPGIDDGTKAHLFELFHTGPKLSADGRRGLGLGLALSKSIITAHGGTIEVRDRIPHGVIFEFSLPAEEVTYHGEERESIGY